MVLPSSWLTFLTGPLLIGVPIIALFTLNYYAWPVVALAVIDDTRVDQTHAVPRPGDPVV